MRFWLLALLAVSVALEGMSTAHAQSNVQITSILCSGDPEVVGLRNNGSVAQDLTGWQIRSDPVGSEFLDLTPLGTLDPGDGASIFGGPGAPPTDLTINWLRWTTDYVFRDNDVTDFARLVNAADGTVDQENCPAEEPTVTPTATATATATATSAPGETATATPTTTPSPTPSHTPSPTPSPTPSATPSPTPSPTPMGPPQTVLTALAAAGSAQISVADTARFAVGDYIAVGSGETLDINTIDGIGGGAPGIFALAGPLEFDHEAGETVLRIPAPTPTPTPTPTETPTPAATPEFTLTPKATTIAATATPIAAPPTGSGGDGGIGGLGLVLALLLAAALLAGTASLIAFSFRQQE